MSALSPQMRTTLLAVGAAVSLLVLFLAVINPLLLSDDPVNVDIPDRSEPEIPAPPDDSATTEEPLPETIEVFTARDPFHQLVRPANDPDAGDPGPGGPSGGDPDGNGGSGDPEAPGTPSDGAQVGATTIVLVEVFTGDDGLARVIVDVNGTLYTAAEGETFASRFRVLDITGQCATLLFGDNRFVLCAGETIRK